MSNIPEFFDTDAEWEASEGAGLTEIRSLTPTERMRAVLQRVADFNFLDVLEASPSPKAREAYTQLMVEVQLVLRATKEEQRR